jgi:hypothetical protein
MKACLSLSRFLPDRLIATRNYRKGSKQPVLCWMRNTGLILNCLQPERFYRRVGREFHIGGRAGLQRASILACFRSVTILLQKSKVAERRIFRENTKRKAIADSYYLNRVTEVACEFCVRR